MNRQYKVIDVTDDDAQTLQNALRTTADDGWKLLKIIEKQGRHMVVFEK